MMNIIEESFIKDVVLELVRDTLGAHELGFSVSLSVGGRFPRRRGLTARGRSRAVVHFVHETMELLVQLI